MPALTMVHHQPGGEWKTVRAITSLMPTCRWRVS